jgi:outer membrane lipoprotein-sorting protein
MLIPLYLVLQQTQSSGLQRMHDFITRVKSFSVQIAVTSNAVRYPGKGTLIVAKPGNFRLTIQWGTFDYAYIKGPNDALEYERSRRTYMNYPKSNGLTWESSIFSSLQTPSFPTPLLTGTASRLIPSDAKYKVVSRKNGVETYKAEWSSQMSKGRAVVSIGADGRLLHFEQLSTSIQGTIHRTMDFSNYVFNPPVSASTFSTIPPPGLTAQEFEPTTLPFELGDSVHLGTWKSANGAVDLDARVKGKLLIVREPDSPQADALLAYLQTQKLPVDAIVASVGGSGGQVWSPPPGVGSKISGLGTPLMILFDNEGKVKKMWLGFDAENAAAIVPAIAAALKEG